MSTEAFDFPVEHFFGFLFVYFLFCFVVLAEKDLLQAQTKRQADSCPKKFRAPQRFSAKHFKKSGEGGEGCRVCDCAQLCTTVHNSLIG